MIVNRYKIQQTNTDYSLTIPIEIDNTYLGLDMGVDTVEKQIIDEITSDIKNYEIARFSHESSVLDPLDDSLNINFNFYMGGTIWEPTYLTIFSGVQIYYNTTAFNNSFFKIDFYDSNQAKKQKIIFTTVIPSQQGIETDYQLFPTWYANGGVVKLKTPQMVMTPITEREGYYLYFLEDPKTIGITEFYVSIKFFNGTAGDFIRMMTEIPSTFTNNSFNPDNYKYLKLILNYNNFTYRYEKLDGTIVGTYNSPINVYEYVNP